MNETQLSTPTGDTSYLRTPPRYRAPDGYRPSYRLVPEAFGHEHRLDTYQTADEHEIVYCTLCGME